jgi:hypothetical protein
MFQEGEHDVCPVCGVPLAELSKLPPSHDAEVEAEAPRDPNDDKLPLAYFGRGRGPLVLLALVGLVLFFLPWMHETLPDKVDYSGVAMARRLVWPWGAGVGWFVTLPTILSRRTVRQMRGARVAAAFLAGVPAMTVATLLLFPPRGTQYITLRFTYTWPFYATLVTSLIALGFALTFGGRALQPPSGGSAEREGSPSGRPPRPPARGRTRGHVLH